MTILQDFFICFASAFFGSMIFIFLRYFVSFIKQKLFYKKNLSTAIGYEHTFFTSYNLGDLVRVISGDKLIRLKIIAIEYKTTFDDDFDITYFGESKNGDIIMFDFDDII